MLPNFAKLESKIEALEQWMIQMGEYISCTQEDVRVLRRMLSLQNGLAPKQNDNDARFQPRLMTKAPFAIQDSINTTRVISEAELTTGLLGRYSSDGWYSNIGSDPYTITIFYADDGVVSRTVPAGTNYAITSFVKSVQIDSIAGKPAVFQLELR